MSIALFLLLVVGQILDGDWQRLTRIGLRATWAGAVMAARRNLRGLECGKKFVSKRP
jgi:hypothetical protein